MTKGEVKSIIKHNFPNSKIVKLKEFSEGFNNTAYDVSIKNPKKNLVIKLLRSKFIRNLDKQAQKEQAILSLVSKQYPKFPYSKLLIHDSSKKLINKPYLINKKLEGISFNEAFDKIKNKEEVFEQLGKLKGKLHSIHFKKFGSFDENGKLTETYNSWYKKECKEMHRIFNGIKKSKVVSDIFLERHKKLWNKIKHYLKKDPKPCLCQGDPSLSNIIVIKSKGKWKINGLIDFEFAHSGDPMDDLGRSWRTFHTKTVPYLHYLIKGYKKYNNLPKDWEIRVWIYQWKQNLNSLEHVKTAEWKELETKEKQRKRRKFVRDQSVKQADIILKKLEGMEIKK